MMLTPAADYSSQVNSPASAPPFPLPSAPELSLLKNDPPPPDDEGYELLDPRPELERDLEQYVHINAGDVVAGSVPNVPPPAYSSFSQYMPYQHQRYRPSLAEDQPVQVHSPAFGETCKDNLTELFKKIMHLAIEGVQSSDLLPSFLAIWCPDAVESTISRRNRYLREFSGNQCKATEECIRRNHSVMKQVKVSTLALIPHIGTAAGYTLTLWHQLRVVTLIAAIHGHDVHQVNVQIKIFDCLLGGNVLKIAGRATDHIIQEVAKAMILKLGINEGLAGIMPLNVIFNLLTDDAAKVSGHAKKVFAGEHSLPASGYN